MSAVDAATTFWLEALASPLGVGLTVSDPGRAKTQLYTARKRLLPRFPKLEAFTIRTSPEHPAYELYLLYDPAKDPTREASHAPPSAA